MSSELDGSWYLLTLKFFCNSSWEKFVDSDLKYDENPNGEHAWVCVDFIYHDSRGGTEKSLWVKTDQTKAGMGESCEWKDAPIGDELEGKIVAMN